MKNHLPDTYRHPLPDGLYYDLVRIQPGTFIMGSEGEEAFDLEKPEHLVRLTRDYYIGVYPVTQAVWKGVMDGHNPSHFSGDDRPVECVSWLDIVEGGQNEDLPEGFLTKLNRLCPALNAPGALKDFRFRLPTEAEWEYAAKGGHRTALTKTEMASPPKADERYALYAGSGQFQEVGWGGPNSGLESKAVGLKRPSALGLHDMNGNVEEWCWDWFGDSYYQYCADQGIVEQPTGPEEGSLRALRGGSWSNGPRGCRSTYRDRWYPSERDDSLGFRLVFAN